VLPVPVRLLPDRNASRYLGRPMSDIGLATAIDLKRAPLGVWERGVKTSIDFLIAALGLILFAPLLAAAALMIKLDSRGPVFFWQTRVGFNGQRFRILKFRTMRTLEDGDMIRQASRNDDRVTRVGRWLRATSVDELPQLVNVLLGQMAIVGPRPHAAAHDGEFDRTIANYALRHNVKPGITGWAQVCGFRGETPTIELVLKRVEHDLWYIHNWSFWLDLTILARTIAVLINPKDVY
jgi:undecaprenyl-phosphate galactose phosphotransferase/putative colanic acid biosynthesis UDP-glucose lipid carrier transferase